MPTQASEREHDDITISIPVFYSPAYHAGGPDFDTTRKSAWIARSLEDQAIDGLELRSPEPATANDLARVHARTYIDAVRTGEPAHLAGSNGIGWDAGLWASVTASTGGVVAAARSARRTGSAGSLSSGLHHAKQATGDGFCTFNGLAVAATLALEEGAGRVLVIDLDAHCGGGTAELLGGDPRVVAIDIATSPFDGYAEPAGWSLDLVLDPDIYLPTLRARLATIDTDGIGLVLYNAGMDPFERCGTGGLAGITREVMAEREATVFGWARERCLPIAFVLAGGYTGYRLGREELVDLHRLTLEAAVAHA